MRIAGRFSMSVKVGLLENREYVQKVVAMYTSPEKPTSAEVAILLKDTAQNIRYILRSSLPKDAWRAECALRYSRGKIASKNPMHGKKLAAHPNWKGVVSDDKGHLTIKMADGTRQFVHRVALAEALGLPVSALRKFDVHHIDGNGENNALDNLALVTKKGHRSLHRVWSLLKDSPLWERYRSMISS